METIAKYIEVGIGVKGKVGTYPSKITEINYIRGLFFIYETTETTAWGNPGSNMSGIADINVDNFEPINEILFSETFINNITSKLWMKAPYGKSKGTKLKMCFPDVGQLNYDNMLHFREDFMFFQAKALYEKNLNSFITSLKIC